MALTISSVALAQTDSPWLNWVSSHSPHGFDVTPDGTIWINLAKTGQRDDYAIRAGDLKEARDTNNRFPIFWLRGYHRNNPSLPYRESKSRFYVQCANEQIQRTTFIFYKANGDVYWQGGPEPLSYVVPGSLGEQLHRAFCITGD